MENICINCRYNRFAGFKGLPNNSTMEMGRCHFLPPNINGQLPMVKPFDWCSKFKKITRHIRKRMKKMTYPEPERNG